MTKTAFLFSGQGAQKVGMLLPRTDSEKISRLCKMAEKHRSGLLQLMDYGAQAELDMTINAQPAMYLADLIYAYMGEEKGFAADSCLGFSLGEIPALSYAGAFDVETGFLITLERARLMQQYVTTVKGGMVAVLGLEREEVEEIASLCGCFAVNFNAQKQTVVAAREENIAQLLQCVASRKGKAIRLAVAGAFHCELLEKASEQFYEFLVKLKLGKPTMTVYANETAQSYCGDTAQNLARQMMRPVEFYKSILNMRGDGVEKFYEAGPGGVLTGLIKKSLVGVTIEI